MFTIFITLFKHSTVLYCIRTKSCLLLFSQTDECTRSKNVLVLFLKGCVKYDTFCTYFVFSIFSHRHEKRRKKEEEAFASFPCHLNDKVKTLRCKTESLYTKTTKQLVSQLACALSPVNHTGLYQGNDKAKQKKFLCSSELFHIFYSLKSFWKDSERCNAIHPRCTGRFSSYFLLQLCVSKYLQWPQTVFRS